MHSRLLALGIAILGYGQPVIAQENSEHVSLFRPHDAVVAMEVIALGAATMSVDESIARALQRPSTRSNSFLKGTTNLFSNLGFPGSAMITAGAYFLGLEKRSRPIAAPVAHGRAL